MIIEWHSHIYTPEEAADDIRTWDGNSGPTWGEHGCTRVPKIFLDDNYKKGFAISVVNKEVHYRCGK